MANTRKRRRKSQQAIAGGLMLAPVVAAMRLPLLAHESQKLAPFRTESMKAVTEKLAAAREGIAEAQLSYYRSMMSFWPELLSGRTPSLLTGAATEQAMNAALRPASRRVKANFKRLTGSN